MAANRREFLRQVGLGLIAIHTAGAIEYLSPAEARASDAYSFQVLGADERATLAALGEVLLPGCVTEGFCEFIDYQLSLPAEDCLLMLRYLDVPPPYAAFYAAGLAGLDGLANAEHKQGFARCSAEQQTALVRQISFEQPAAWQGPPSPLFYFTLRSDAVDVYYGTEAGFERLDIPYMAHITPTQPW